MKSAIRKLITVFIAVGIVAAVGYGLIPEPVEVDLAKIGKGAIRVTVDQDGKTRIRERYVVSTPLAGRLLRIDLDPGDEVKSGETLLATIEPRDPELLDARSIAQAEARVKAAEVALQQMVPMLEKARADQEFAETELKRTRDARSRSPQAVSESEIQSKLLAYRTSTALLRSASHNEEIARFELDQTRAALIRSRPQAGAAPPAGNGTNGWNFTIRSPINGRVLRVFQESSAVVSAGTPLLELGDPRDLEVEIDVLSRDAVKIPAGAQVLLEHWGGPNVLQGRVRLVEPSAFTKISTLGVEEQRVNVIVDLLDPPPDRTSLGDGFRVEARIIVQEADDVLKAPTSALFRVGERWAVFRVERGVARQQRVQLGLRNGLEAEVLEGLSVGDQVVVHPGDHIADGTAVHERE
ncbi:MAG: HlyD family efflux transporter periplasmic adaptor subunit [Planctomycetes bacterium]|nr:HlyD family efflux transporter periplasmic adaptor subunit [Planctomycetota bacterium]